MKYDFIGEFRAFLLLMRLHRIVEWSKSIFFLISSSNISFPYDKTSGILSCLAIKNIRFIMNSIFISKLFIFFCLAFKMFSSTLIVHTNRTKSCNILFVLCKLLCWWISVIAVRKWPAFLQIYQWNRQSLDTHADSRKSVKTYNLCSF